MFKFTLAPNSTRRLAYFVYRGLTETGSGPEDCAYYGGCVLPPAGSQVALAQTISAALAANPPFCDLSLALRATIVNWPKVIVNCTYLPAIQK